MKITRSGYYLEMDITMNGQVSGIIPALSTSVYESMCTDVINLLMSVQRKKSVDKIRVTQKLSTKYTQGFYSDKIILLRGLEMPKETYTHIHSPY